MLLQRRNVCGPRQCIELGRRVVDRAQRSGECTLHNLQRQRRSPQSHRFVKVLEYDRVLAVDISAARSPETNLVPNGALKLESNVLDYVRGIRPALETRDEAAPFPDAAAMFLESGHRRDESGGETRHVR
jgi:hypothetical protein